MKSRIEGQKYEKLMASSEGDYKGFSSKPTTSELAKFLKGKVTSDFYEASNELQEGETIIDILIEMMGEEYLDSYRVAKKEINVQSKSVRKKVQTEVSNLVNEKVIGNIKIVMESKGKNSKIYESMLTKLQSTDYVINSIFKQYKMPRYYHDRLKKAILKFVAEAEQKKEAMSAREIAEQKQIEEFVSQASEQTFGFDFLADDMLVYTAETGKRHRENTGFKQDYDSFFKFKDVQAYLRKMMEDYKYSEKVAIKTLLNDNNKRTKEILEDYELDEGQKRILEARLNVLNQKTGTMEEADKKNFERED